MAVQTNMHALDPRGRWVPVRVDSVGELAGGGFGGGSGGIPSSNPQIIEPWVYAGANGGITDDEDVVLAAAPGAGRANYLTSLQVINVDDTTGTEIVIKDGSTVIWRSYLAEDGLVPSSIVFERPLIGSNNSALNFACVTSGATVYVSAQGYVEASLDLIKAGQTSELELVDASGNMMVDGSSNQIIVPIY